MRQEGLRDLQLPVDVTSCPCLLFITVHLEECVFLLSPPAAPLSKLDLVPPCSSPSSVCKSFWTESWLWDVVSQGLLK